MKKYLKMLVAVLVVFGAIALTATAAAQSFQSADFLNGSGNLVLATASTNTYGGTNVWLQYGSGYSAGYATNAMPTYDTTNTSAIKDVPLWANRDGSLPSANVSVELVATNNTTGTNIVTFNFAPIPRGVGTRPETVASRIWSFTVTATGTTPAVFSTNLPSLFTGSGGMRLTSVQTTGPGSTTYITRVALNGFKP